MTGEELVREVAEQYRMWPLPPEAVDNILWEKTSFPFDGEPELRIQLHSFFSRVERDRILAEQDDDCG